MFGLPSGRRVLLWGAPQFLSYVLSLLGTVARRRTTWVCDDVNVEYVPFDMEVSTVLSSLVEILRKDDTGYRKCLLIVEDTDRLLCIFNNIKNGGSSAPGVRERSACYVVLTKIEQDIVFFCNQCEFLIPYEQGMVHSLCQRLCTILRNRWQYVLEQTR